MNNCPECGGNLRQANYEVICASCGLIVEDTVLEQPIEHTSLPSRPALASAGTFTQEGKIVKTGWLFSTRQKNLLQAYQEIQMLGERHGLPAKAISEAQVLFKRAVEANLNIGRENVTLAYASVYAACRILGLPKTPLELTAFTGVSKHKMLQAYRIMVRGLGLRLTPIRPADLLPRFGSQLGLAATTISRAATILEERAEAILRSSKRPESIVAAVLYLAAKETGEEKTQREIANTVGVIEVTIRKQSKELLRAKPPP